MGDGTSQSLRDIRWGGGSVARIARTIRRPDLEPWVVWAWRIARTQSREGISAARIGVAIVVGTSPLPGFSDQGGSADR